jgi:5'-3' exonuclease
MNAILHVQLRRASSEEHALTLIFQRLHATLRLVRPGSHVLLALDGPAPLAKLSTQRARRQKVLQKKARRRGISSLVATPGTAFMARLEQALLYFICSELATCAEIAVHIASRRG